MICHFVLYVTDQEKSTQFYESVLDMKPSLNTPGMTEFTINDTCVLGLQPISGIINILGDKIRNPAEAVGVPRAELYLRVPSPRIAYERAEAFKAKILSPFQERSWGYAAGYFEDPDGHIIAFSE